MEGASAACASADGVLQPTIAVLVDKRVIFESRHHEEAKSTRRVMLLARMGSPTCRLQTGRPWLSLLRGRSLLQPSTSRCLQTRAGSLHLVIEVHDAGGRASRPTTCTSSLIFHEYTSLHPV